FRTSRKGGRKRNSNGSSLGLRNNFAPRWTASWAAIALIYLYFLRSERAKDCYGGGEKIILRLGTVREDAALCSLDSDLLPPRSRYPLKWARNRQPSPPPVALPGPLLCGPPLPRP